METFTNEQCEHGVQIKALSGVLSFKDDADPTGSEVVKGSFIYNRATRRITITASLYHENDAS